MKSTATTVKLSTVPAYLRDSESGASLNYDDDEEFFVPIGVTKQTPEVDSLMDLAHLLATVRFWGLREIPQTVFAFAFSHKDPNKIARICNQFKAELKQLVIVVEELTEPNENSITDAMRSGFLDVVKYLHSSKHKFTKEGVQMAVANGHADCLKYALQVDPGLAEGACTAAVVYGNAACIQTVLQSLAETVNTSTFTPSESSWGTPYTLCDVAACAGDSTYMEDARRRGWHCNSRTAAIAAYCGQLHCLKYLHEHGCALDNNLVSAAVKRKQFACAAYALQHGAGVYPDSYETVNCIVAAGELRCLVLLAPDVHASNSTRVKPCLLAAQHGHLRCLSWLHDNRYYWDATVTTAAAENGHYDCLWYAVQQGCPVEQRMCSLLVKTGGEQLLLQYAQVADTTQMERVAVCAAVNGYMNCLTYVVERGCRKIADACAAAAAHGKLQCLQYLHQQGYPMDHNTAYHAARNARYECLEYVLQQNCQVDARTAECLAARGELRLLQLALRLRGYSTTNAVAGPVNSVNKRKDKDISIRLLIAAARHGKLACLLYLVEHYGFPCGRDVSAAAVSSDQWECVRYLAQQGCRYAKRALRGY